MRLVGFEGRHLDCEILPADPTLKIDPKIDLIVTEAYDIRLLRPDQRVRSGDFITEKRFVH